MANDNDSDLIEAAVSEAVKNMEDYRDGDILVEWVVICYVTNPDREKGDAHPILFSNGMMPTHHAIGLLQKSLVGLSFGLFEGD